jgi:DNA polymerase-3 subunit gamma/tau
MSQNSYLVLARKYRPQNFSEIMGQEVLITTLQNAIQNNRLHHAYILTGIRGVGKTTTARIIAKTINCLKAINTISCGVCDNCLAITASKHQDVIEIDAASRTGVDDIREIIDSIAYAPVMARYKIYIIDEVHMLSNNAFNALLKTLEEPPHHVKFIFATTEIKKVPITILSRCQRFNLRRLDEKEIEVHLRNILQKEGFEVEKQGLELIAKMSEGSVRDALSLTDQALAANNHQQFLSAEIIIKMLGLNDAVKVIDVFEAILSGDFTASLNNFHKIYTFSSDVPALLQDLMETVYQAVSVKLLPSYNLQGLPESSQTRIKKIAEQIPLASLIRIWQVLMKGGSEINFFTSPKMAFEMLLARLCYLVALPNLKNILPEIYKNNLNNSIAEKDCTINDSEAATDNGDEILHEILRNFEGAKIIN